MIKGIKSVLSRMLRGLGVSEGGSGFRATSFYSGGYQLQGTAMNVSTVFRCVKLLSESVACLPVRWRYKSRGVYVSDESHRVDYLFNVAPNRRQSAFEFKRDLVAELLLDGNAYIIPVYGRDLELAELVLCRRGSVAVDEAAATYTVNDSFNNIHRVYSAEEIIHLKGHVSPFNPAIGISVLSYARMSTDIAIAGDKETYDRFITGGNIRGIVTGGGNREFGKAAFSEVDRSADDLSDKIESGRRIISLPDEVKFDQLSLSSTDMQFLESRKFTVREICRFFGVHPSFVFDDTSNNYKSAEQASVAFLSYTVNPLLCNIEGGLMKLVPPDIAGRVKIEFDRQGLYTCDIASRQTYMKGCLEMGWSVNELRQANNMPPIDGGDIPMVSANLKPARDIGNES